MVSRSEWSGSTIEYHRNQVREHLGFRVCSIADADKLTDWLAGHVAHAERNLDRVREELLRRCWEERIGAPGGGPGHPHRALGAAQRGGDVV